MTPVVVAPDHVPPDKLGINVMGALPTQSGGCACIVTVAEAVI
jgi:hypothetical protein